MMEPFAAFTDHLLSPPGFYTLALLLFFAVARWRLAERRAGAFALLAVLAVPVAAGLADPDFRHRLLAPERLPAAVAAAATMVFLVLFLTRSRAGADDDVDAGVDDAGWRGPSRRELDAVVAVALAFVAWVAFVPTPLAAPADPGAPPDPARFPWFFAGFQELRHYLEPWFAGVLLPALFLAALFALPHLDLAATGEEIGSRRGRREEVAAFLFGALLLGAVPMVIAVFLRGPHWQPVDPFAAVASAGPAASVPVPFSELFWCRWLGRNAPPLEPLVRELPGLFLLAGYLVAVPILLPRWKATRGVFGRYRKGLGGLRYYFAVVLGLIFLLVPLKMYGRWLFDLGRWIHFPEFGFGF
jgi:hypothetical protein